MKIDIYVFFPIVLGALHCISGWVARDKWIVLLGGLFLLAGGARMISIMRQERKRQSRL